MLWGQSANLGLRPSPWATIWPAGRWIDWPNFAHRAKIIVMHFRKKLKFSVKSYVPIGQTAMYLVSLESSLKMEENGGGFMLVA